MLKQVELVGIVIAAEVEAIVVLLPEGIGGAEVQVEVGNLEGMTHVLIPILGPILLHVHVHHPVLTLALVPTHALDHLGQEGGQDTENP